MFLCCDKWINGFHKKLVVKLLLFLIQTKTRQEFELHRSNFTYKTEKANNTQMGITVQPVPSWKKATGKNWNERAASANKNLFHAYTFSNFWTQKKRDGIFRSPERRRESLVKFLIGYYKDRELTTNPICVSIASIRGIRRESATTSLIKKKFGICRADGIPLNSSIVWKFPDFDV